MSDQSQDLPQPSGRQDALLRLQNLKMTESAHRFVRGSATQFYKWLANLDANLIPTGPAVWICGDCHVGNLGPVANAQGKVEIQIRDLDQTVIGNPAHDLLRLALSLASAARGSDLPGVATFLMMESLMEGYELAFAPDFDAEADLETPPSIAMSLGTSTRANWKTLAVEKLSTEAAHLSLGEKFWPLAKNEHEDVSEAVKAGEVKHLATMLKSRPTEADVHLLDAAYWVKGCSSLGKLRYAALIAVASKKKKHHSYGLLDFKEGVGSVAPPASEAQMP